MRGCAREYHQTGLVVVHGKFCRDRHFGQEEGLLETLQDHGRGDVVGRRRLSLDGAVWRCMQREVFVHIFGLFKVGANVEGLEAREAELHAFFDEWSGQTQTPKRAVSSSTRFGWGGSKKKKICD